MLKLTVEMIDLDKEISRDVWVPKSQVINGAIKEWWFDQFESEYSNSNKYGAVEWMVMDAEGKAVSAYIDPVQAELNAKAEANRKAALTKVMDERAAVVAFLKAAGVKAHDRLKTSTLKEKLAGLGVTWERAVSGANIQTVAAWEPKVGDKVKTGAGKGVIVALDDDFIKVDLGKRIATFMNDGRVRPL